MKHTVIRKEYRDNTLIDTVIMGEYNSTDEADDAICSDVSDFRDHHDNDERVDWNVVEVYDDIGHCNRFEWNVKTGE